MVAFALITAGLVTVGMLALVVWLGGRSDARWEQEERERMKAQHFTLERES